MKLFNFDNLNDLNLWDRFLTGDDGAYEFIYKKYSQDLFSYGMRFTYDREIVKDCMQDVFLKIYNNRYQLTRVQNLRFYLYVALKNSLFNVFDKTGNMYNIDTVEPVFNLEYTVEQKMIDEEDDLEIKDNIVNMLSQLTPHQKEIIHYRFMEGLKIREIGQIMHMNEQSVHNLLLRTIKKIRKILKKKEEVITRKGAAIKVIHNKTK